MKKLFQSYYATCLSCQRRRPRLKSVLEGHMVTNRVGNIIAIDVVGPLTFRVDQIYLLTMIDHFSKYATRMMKKKKVMMKREDGDKDDERKRRMRMMKKGK